MAKRLVQGHSHVLGEKTVDLLSPVFFTVSKVATGQQCATEKDLIKG